MSAKSFGMATAIATAAIATVVVPFSTANAISNAIGRDSSTHARSAYNINSADRNSENRNSAVQIAQRGETGCRQTNATVGVYGEAVEGAAPTALIESDTPVKLAIIGSQPQLDGWAYISQPTTGWVRSRYLTDCSAAAEAAFSPVVRRSPQAAPSTTTITTTPGLPIRSETPSSGISRSPERSPERGLNPTPRPSSDRAVSSGIVQTPPQAFPSSPPAVPPTSSTQAAVPTIACDILPIDGLTVRTQPNLARETYWLTLPPGTHAFRFTRNTVTENGRRWVYITSPAEGWVLLNQPDGSSTIGGDRCG